jgi:hypothetical protein
MVEKVTYGKLRDVLATLGYRPARSTIGAVGFRNPSRRLMIILPEMRDEECVLPIDLLSTRSTLVEDGVLPDDKDAFDALFLIRKGDRLVWTDPRTGEESKVTAAAGESDGLVVVRRDGRLWPFPGDQVRRIRRAVAAAQE